MSPGSTLANSGNEDAFIIKYSDFIQSIILPRDCQSEQNKVIKIGEYQNAHTLITSPDGFISDSSNNLLRGFMLTDKCSFVNISYLPNTWIISNSNNVLLIFP
nr:WD repeat containing protein [Mimivirus sp.]